MTEIKGFSATSKHKIMYANVLSVTKPVEKVDNVNDVSFLERMLIDSDDSYVVENDNNDDNGNDDVDNDNSDEGDANDDDNDVANDCGTSDVDDCDDSDDDVSDSDYKDGSYQVVKRTVNPKPLHRKN